ncbi:MAG: hypothetical protein O7I42_17315 [Alphaproteobacteria bacterium]|nr:hypothetical protein [Alphaproteobacteria bacterium]
MTLLKTLIQPDHDENQERAEVADAANLLQVGEFQLLQLAFHDWHERDMPQAMVDPIFTRYMFHNDVPFWARQYARKILEIDKRGELDDNQPHYHRYDAEYRTHVPGGAKKFIWAAMILVVAIFGSILLADGITSRGGSIFPPYFDSEDMKRKP